MVANLTITGLFYIKAGVLIVIGSGVWCGNGVAVVCRVAVMCRVAVRISQKENGKLVSQVRDGWLMTKLI